MVHESLHREESIRLPANRSFGIGCAIGFVIVGLLPLWSGGGVRVWALDGAAACAVLAFVAAGVYTPLNRAWMQLGLLLNRIGNPIVLAVMFFAAVLPMGLFLRTFRRHWTLKQGYDAAASSYWERRARPGLDPKSLERQF